MRQIGYIGLGKMGRNMVLRLLEQGWRVTAFDQSESIRHSAVESGIEAADSVIDVLKRLTTPRLVWIMVPNGAVEAVVGELLEGFDEGDTLIDGGNTFFEDTLKRSARLKERGINFLDVGVSGGPRGACDGASMMIGGERFVFEKYEKLFAALCARDGYGFMGKSGAGHFVKMVHNGIEYGMMQALAEGFSIMKESGFNLKLKDIARVYGHGSVIESRLIDWLQEGFEKYGENLEGVSGEVGATGEGEWTVATARKLGVPAPIIEGALCFRAESNKHPSYTGKILSTLRNMFGGHKV